ncbi:dienelactone hydrolase family protein [Aquimarina aquimarini]|uniref:dienelactone hydrolase family protein n=1 Tax=Aquimarina aquimarini TaxID=1191734 RepID=UPI000D55F0B8|nr:alpha/beta hydrolase [Aquimarina aquimarini]
MRYLKTLILFSCFMSICKLSFAQCDKDLDMFNHYSVKLENDTINYHTYAKRNIDSLTTILLYIQGSKASSLYQVKREKEKSWIGTTVPINLKNIPNNYLFVLISKKGIPFCTKLDEDIPVPESYYKNQTLDYRTLQADQVIKDLTKRHKNNFKKIIALGHSEGSDVIAKLGTINNDITHFGYWSGGGYTQFLDFITFIRKKVDKNQISEEEAQIEIDSLFNTFKDIMKYPNATDKFWEGKNNSYNRWSHFSEPPIENLLQINKPIFVAIGTKDQAVPIESAYLIPIEFIRHKKNNLTFKTYLNLDHGFGKELKNGKFEEHWDDIFKDFLEWVNKE